MNLNVGINQRRRLASRNGRVVFGTRPRVSRFAVNPRVVIIKHLAIATAQQIGLAVRSIVVVSRVGRITVHVRSRYAGTTIWLLQCRHWDVVVHPRAGPWVRLLLYHPVDRSKVGLAAELSQVGRHTTASRFVVAAVVTRRPSARCFSMKAAVYSATTSLTWPWSRPVWSLGAVRGKDARQPELEISVHVGSQRRFGAIARVVQYRVHRRIAQLKVPVWQWRFVGATESGIREIRV